MSDRRTPPSPSLAQGQPPPVPVPATVAALLLAAVAYVHGLGAQHAMTNGDEALYAHIARRTAQSGDWLPLRCDMPAMVDTKPPFIFWQAILSTDRGRRWTLLDLRWPSLVWTWLTAAVVARTAVRLGAGRGGGLLAAAVYLAFLGTFRYGRPFLTNPPEVFWTFVPCWLLVEFAPASFQSRFLVPTVAGLCLGLAMLAKSFVILAPTGLVLAVWHLDVRGWRLAAFLREALPGLLWTAVVALGVFAIWPLLDPHPEVIWRQFVIGENVGKLRAGSSSYLTALVWGRRSVWALFAGWFIHAGLLAFPVAGTLIRGWQSRRTVGQGERLLWLLCGATFLFYCIPTQRSGRYLLDALPALAVLVALNWHRLLPSAFAATCVAVLAVVCGVAWLSLVLVRSLPEVAIGPLHGVVLAGGAALAVVPLVRPRWLPMLALPAVFAAYLALTGLALAFDPPAGGFDAATIAAARGRVVWYPENFWAAVERERMLLPGADVRGYADVDPGPDPARVGPDDLIIVRRGLDEPAPDGALGRRLDMGSRFTAAEFRDIVSDGATRLLFRHEWLVPMATLSAAASEPSGRIDGSVHGRSGPNPTR